MSYRKQTRSSNKNSEMYLDNSVSYANAVSRRAVAYEIIPLSSLKKVVLNFGNKYYTTTGPDPETIPIPFSVLSRDIHVDIPFSIYNSDMMRVMQSGKRTKCWADEDSDDE
jgi:hypothetical protein